MTRSNFREWNLDQIELTFGLRQVRELPVLETLLAFPYSFSAFEQQYLSDLQAVYQLGGDDWNEVELENKAISPLFVFAQIDNERFAYFLERELSAVLGEYELSGRVDGMIATGFRSPRQPYFCMNEYKRATDPNGDPRGQVLIAMMAAQILNDERNPIIGCYIIGKAWSFVALIGTEYAISKTYTFDSEGIFDIYRILKGVQAWINQLISKE